MTKAQIIKMREAFQKHNVYYDLILDGNQIFRNAGCIRHNSSTGEDEYSGSTVVWNDDEGIVTVVRIQTTGAQLGAAFEVQTASYDQIFNFRIALNKDNVITLVSDLGVAESSVNNLKKGLDLQITNSEPKAAGWDELNN